MVVVVFAAALAVLAALVLVCRALSPLAQFSDAVSRIRSGTIEFSLPKGFLALKACCGGLKPLCVFLSLPLQARLGEGR